MKYLSMFLLCLLLEISSITAGSDSLRIKSDKFPYIGVASSVVLIGYGVSGLISDEVKSWNLEVKNSLQNFSHGSWKIDNFIWATPALTVYSLDWCGVRAKHSFEDRTILLASSIMLMEAVVQTLKYTTKEMRPDGSSDNSFPSGHSALAFVCADFLCQEYVSHSIWYGIAGYSIAASVGFLRMYNNKHWLTDVVAGAGFGIFSSRLCYWIYPYLTRKGRKENKAQTFVMPYCGKNEIVVSFVSLF